MNAQVETRPVIDAPGVIPERYILFAAIVDQTALAFAFDIGLTIADLRTVALEASSWSDWQTEMNSRIEALV